ncbi:LysE family translocator [Microbulbifer sp. ANSA003]|uniref:LysE family translocator n=1 Tax=Microbulbifer sp. ANSA003 TaxID=3243360 RepID=UPI0040436E15
MNIELVLGYCAIIAVLLISPGPSVLLSINNGINYGKKIAAIGVLGNVFAFQILTLIGASGLGIALTTFTGTLIAIQLIGAGYLCYLGLKILSSPAIKLSAKGVKSTFKPSPWKIFRQAFLVTSLNPKALIFIIALLPQFITDSEKLTPQIAILCIISASIHFAIYFGYALLAENVAQISSSDLGRKVFDRLSGITFLIFGIGLASTNIAN